MIVIGPDGPRAFHKYWLEEKMPFPGCADIGSKIADLYRQEVNIFKLGRMPAEFLLDQSGVIRYLHYGESMNDIPTVDELIKQIEMIKK